VAASVARPASSSWRVKPTLSSAVPLGLAAGLIGAIYGLGLVLPQPVWAGQPAGPTGAGEPRSAAGWPGILVAAGFALILCAPYRPYVLALRVARRDAALSPRLALALTAALACVGLLIYPRFGSDIFDYVGYERLWSVYRENPLVTPVTSHPADWSYAFVWFRDRAPAYGPLWTLLTWPLVWLAGDSPVGDVVAYKLLALGTYVGSCALIWYAVEADRRVRALLVFGWSPLVLFDLLGKVHNDGLTGIGVLLAVVLVGRGRGRLGLVGGVAAGLVKVSAAAVLPILALAELRRGRWRSLLVGMGLSLGLVGLAYAPFWAGPDTLRVLFQQAGRVVWSPGSLLIAATSSETAARVILLLAGVTGYGLLALRGRPDSSADLATTSAGALVLSLLVLTTAFYAHYLIPVVALAALSGNVRLERLVTALSIGSLAAYAVELLSLAFGSAWNGSVGYQVVGSLVTLGPAAVVGVLSLRPTVPEALP
jgi:hypothetical protein